MTAPADLSDLADYAVAVLSGVDDLVLLPDGQVYERGQAGIVHGVLGQDPDEGVGVLFYPVTDAALTDESLVGMNLRWRGDEDVRTVQRRSSAAFDAFQGLQEFEAGVFWVQLVWRQNSNPVGTDENQRWEWQDSYYWRVNWPTANRVL